MIKFWYSKHQIWYKEEKKTFFTKSFLSFRENSQNEIWAFDNFLQHHSREIFIYYVSTTIFTDKLSVQKETYNAICADMDTTFAEMAGF